MILSQATFTIILLVVTLVVMAGQWLRADLTALLVMLVLIASRILSPTEAFSAFGHPVILIVASIFIIGAALLDTGVATLIANQILRFGRRGEAVLMFVVMLTAAILTSSLDGLLVVALLLPAVLAVMAGYITPLTDGDNLLVRDPGQYTMRDYVVNTVPIFLLQTTALIAMLTVIYGP